MHYATSPTHSHVSAKVWGSQSQTVSSTWSDHSVDHSLFIPGQSVSWSPTTPSIASVPLPGSSTFRNNYHYGIATPNLGSGSPSLHPVLVHDREGRLLFNLMHPFVNLRFRPCFPPSVMNEQAIVPRSARVCINIPSFPRWSIEICNPTGVTVREVLMNMHAFFHHRVGKDEFVMFPASIQSSSTSAFSQRTLRDIAERAQGMKRLDFVFPNIFIVGLSRAADGSDRWDIHLSSAVRS